MQLIPGFVRQAMLERPLQLLDLCRKLPEGGFTWNPHPRARSIRNILAHMMAADRHWLEFAAVRAAFPGPPRRV